jgi:hypothetical protein
MSNDMIEVLEAVADRIETLPLPEPLPEDYLPDYLPEEPE